jgi:serine protease Do
MKNRLPLFFGLVAFSLSPLALSQSCLAADAQNIFVPLAKKLVPSVVNIQTTSTIKTPTQQGGGPEDMFRKFFEDYFRHQQQGGGQGVGPRGGGDQGEEDEDMAPPPGKGGKPPKAMSLGTGFIIDPSGLILTNNHVVADADEIKIQFTEETEEKLTDGVVVGRDVELDVALIKVKTKRDLVPVVLGDSDATDVGEYVMAVGNPFGQGHSVTHGIISAKGRLSPDFPLAGYLQTDAPINPGNSGGPLVNLKGEVIGINNAIDQRAQGIGFAIPINVVKKILPQLKTKGTVARGYIGVLVNEMSPDLAPKLGVSKDLHAPFVTHVYPGEPADKAGIKPYDVITEFNGNPVHSDLDLIKAVTSVTVGDTAPIKVIRNGKEISLKITVAQRPGVQQAEEKKEEGKKKKGKAATHIDTGMTLENITPEVARELQMSEKSKGVLVDAVGYDGPADRAGLSRGDVIIEVDRKTIKDVDDFYSVVKDKKAYLLRVRRMEPSTGQEAFAVILLDLKD